MIKIILTLYSIILSFKYVFKSIYHLSAILKMTRILQFAFALLHSLIFKHNILNLLNFT